MRILADLRTRRRWAVVLFLLRLHVLSGKVTNSLGLQTNLAQLPRRRCDEATKIEAWLVRRLAGHQRFPFLAQYAIHIRQQFAKIRAEAGRKNYCVKFLSSVIRKNHTVRCEMVDPYTDFN